MDLILSGLIPAASIRPVVRNCQGPSANRMCHQISRNLQKADGSLNGELYRNSLPHREWSSSQGVGTWYALYEARDGNIVADIQKSPNFILGLWGLHFRTADSLGWKCCILFVGDSDVNVSSSRKRSQGYRRRSWSPMIANLHWFSTHDALCNHQQGSAERAPNGICILYVLCTS
jgi:hypothetical protein